jgi:hypothetical protein
MGAIVTELKTESSVFEVIPTGYPNLRTFSADDTLRLLVV